MPFTEHRQFEGYTFDLSPEASGVKLEDLVRLMERVPERRPGKLAGRGGVGFGTIQPLGRVVVKHYSRGGIYRHLVRRRYLGFGKTRAQREFALLEMVRDLGVSAPKPFVCARSGIGCYRNWLFISEVLDHRSLADLSVADPSRTMDLLRKVAQQLLLLIDSSILHVDLHPGNVLVDPNDVVHLIDFDKAQRSELSRCELRDQYLNRWRRAVIKHELPDELSEGLCHLLRLL